MIISAPPYRFDRVPDLLSMTAVMAVIVANHVPDRRWPQHWHDIDMTCPSFMTGAIVGAMSKRTKCRLQKRLSSTMATAKNKPG